MKNSVMKHDEDSASVMSFKESTERSNSRLQALNRNPLLPRKLRSSSSSPRSATPNPQKSLSEKSLSPNFHLFSSSCCKRGFGIKAFGHLSIYTKFQFQILK
jgi:hypothetical protein